MNSQNSFLPTNYKIPDAKSGYFKLKDGANRFRILSPAITGYLYWSQDSKPVRQKEQFDIIPKDIKLNNDGTYTQIKHFWAFLVWNYDQKMVQILEITQGTIQRGLKTKIDNREGKATENDFIVTRSGTGFDTEYDIDVADPSPVPPDAVMALKAKKINLEALYGGGDPFSSGTPLEAQNEPTGRDKWVAMADALPKQNQSLETISPDIAEMAERIENGDENNPFFNE